MANKHWTDLENDLIVADYFDMLKKELKGTRFIKAEHRRNLKNQLDRSEGSIEFKHQNISAILKALGETWIIGYTPAFNFQMSLVDAISRWLAQNKAWMERPPQNAGLQESNSLWIGPPPTSQNKPPPSELEEVMTIAKKFDVAARDDRNRKLGFSGEERVFEHEKSELILQGRNDLSKQVRWVSQEDGDGAGYDILSFTPQGERRLIEVKTTNGWERTPFYITPNELQVANQHKEDWVLLRLWNFSRSPSAFEIRPPLKTHISLTPTSFRADFL